MYAHLKRSSVLPALVLVLAALLAGCGSDSDSKDSKSKKDDGKAASAEKILDRKQKDVDDAEAAVKKKPRDANAKQELARAYVALASPQSAPKGETPPKAPKNRKELLEKAASTLEDLRKLRPTDEVVTSQLASTYMGLGDYDKALPLRRQLSNDNPRDSSAAYGWGLTATSAKNNDEAIQAFTRFLEVTPKTDPRYKSVQRQIALLRKG